MKDDVVSFVWNPTPEAMAAFKARDLELARFNVRLAGARRGKRRKVLMTNGRREGEGYASVGVVRGGAEPGDVLHCLMTFGAASLNR